MNTVFDSSGNYAVKWNGFNINGINYYNISLFSVNQFVPSFTLLNSISVDVPSTLNKINLLEEKSGNFAPVVNIGSGQLNYYDGSEFKAAFKDYITAGQQNVFSAGLSHDPDAAECNANPDNYVYEIQLISKPAGSSLTQADIEIRDTLPSPPYAPLFFYTKGKWGEFNPDVVGDYEFEFSFTDEPGSCEGSPQKTTKRIVFTANNGFQQTDGEYIPAGDPAGTPPVAGAVPHFAWESKYKSGQGIQLQRKEYYKVSMNESYLFCGKIPVFGLICIPKASSNTCNSEIFPSYNDAVQDCKTEFKGRDTGGGWGEILFLLIYNTEVTGVEKYNMRTWNWWD